MPLPGTAADLEVRTVKHQGEEGLMPTSEIWLAEDGRQAVRGQTGGCVYSGVCIILFDLAHRTVQSEISMFCTAIYSSLRWILPM